MRIASLFEMTVALAAATSSFAFQLPQTPAARGSTDNGKNPSSSSPLQSQSPWFAAAPIAIAAIVFSITPPAMATGGDVTKGSQIFEANCAGCHRGGQNFVKEKKTLQKDALEKFVGLDDDKVEKFFKGSFTHKLQFGDKLADQEITDVVTYVVDQARNEKW